LASSRCDGHKFLNAEPLTGFSRRHNLRSGRAGQRRLRQASRLLRSGEPELTLDALTAIEAADIRQSRVFGGQERGA
jgi:hypothetical protein